MVGFLPIIPEALNLISSTTESDLCRTQGYKFWSTGHSSLGSSGSGEGRTGVPSIARHSEPDPICQGPTDQLPCLPCRLREGANREILGIIVSYKVKVKLVVSRGG